MVVAYEDADDVRVSVMTCVERRSKKFVAGVSVATRRVILSRLTGVVGRNQQTGDVSPHCQSTLNTES
jgi:hypothetical protein